MNHRLDLLTVAAIGVTAYVLQNVLHEAVGHGAVCLLLGGEPKALSTAYFDMDNASVSAFGLRLVAAGGAVVNVAAGGLFWWLHHRRGAKRDATGYFLWLSMTINLLTGTGYLLFSGVIGVGDWAVVIDGMEPFWLWNTLMILAGLGAYLLCIWFALSNLAPFATVKDGLDLKRAFRLSFYPYLVGSAATTVGAVLNPLSPIFIATSAAANFGGTSGLAWMTQLYRRPWFQTSDGGELSIERSWFWIVGGAVLLGLHIFVLGPAISF